MPEKKKSAIQDFQSELEIADAQSPDFANLDGEAKKYQKQIDAHTWPKGKTLKGGCQLSMVSGLIHKPLVF